MKKIITGVLASIVGVLGFATAAGAQETSDPTGGAFSTGVSDIQSFVTSTAAGPLFALAAAVVGIMIGLRWLKKAKGAGA